MRAAERPGSPVAAFCAELREVFDQTGLAQRELIDKLDERSASQGPRTPRRSAVSAMLNGTRSSVPDWDLVAAVLDVLLATGKLGLPQRAGFLGAWKKRHERAVQELEALKKYAPLPPEVKDEASGGAVDRPRLLVPDRVALEEHRFPLVPRPELLDEALRARDRQAASGKPQALVLTGDGGIGKSVLLGQLLQRLEDEKDGAVVLITCTPGLASGDPVETNRALGAAVLPRSGEGIIEILTSLRDRYSSVTLLLDTLDLVLDRSVLPGLSAVLAEALRLADVVITCRDQEFHAFLGDPQKTAPRLAGHLTRVQLPMLSADEIVEWSRRYLRQKHPNRRAENAAFLRTLRGQVDDRAPLQRICALPVRLSMACDVYSDKGHIPENLTATRLFQAYWDEKVEKARNIGSVLGTSVTAQAALALAEAMVTASGTLTLRVPKGRLAAESGAGLELLASEGVIRSLGDSWEFFHQSFAEHAQGRWLLRQGLDSEPVEELARELTADHTTLWPLGRSLLSQIEEIEDYRALAARLPADSPEAAQSQVISALGRSEDEPLADVFSLVKSDPAWLATVVPILGEAPSDHAVAAYDALIDAVRDHPVPLAATATKALALLLPRLPGDVFEDRLKSALDAVIQVRRDLDRQVWENLPAQLVGTLRGPGATDGRRP